ncbi:type I DNA topoisomerase [Planctomicrobium piriforme]|uniref:DNA topoisomerase 1 n=1 Tax=Planctomicrobium piriforme TaxID=1576369 RepID=A0A1I3GMV7_9PLAN|nr:type I DNA topoisomerase [Planctomicrobium piriforme]SFI24760.1 DNA topoisomerase-1 [Planctomicrobium piriforme]
MANSKKKLGLVIVESPAKAKKIAGFLGSDYDVRASMGHVRDLPEKAADIPEELKSEAWTRLGVNVSKGFEPLYIISPEKKKTVKELKDLLKNAEELIVATDEDREGESIGWHLVDTLKPTVPVKRMTFSEITKKAILDALKSTRQIDMNLVEAQETRRILDRLYGYTLSPLLWTKIRRGLSAGRVQSVAVRILVQRELERLAFRSGTYWDLKADLLNQGGQSFSAQLSTVGGTRVATGKDFDESTGQIQAGANVLLLSEQAARDLQSRLRSGDWQISSIEHRQQTRKPPAPFTTSTLQQESNRKLNMSARETMQTAQRLYEDGYITYMRTDSVTLSQEAVDASRNRIENNYGAQFLSPSPRQYTNKTKNAQEAHEAIRPAGDEMKTADQHGLSGREARLYDMIWKRTIATQMAEAQLRFDTVTILAGDAEFKATGRKVEFPGYFRAYVEGSDDPEAALEDQDSVLPDLKEGEKVRCKEIEALGHETKPPARYTEATLVRKLEAEGIGRPSTYASIISTVQDRGYVRKANNQLIPTFTALAVTRLLETYFPNLVDGQFTAQMEQSLDDISNGETQRLPYLEKFYSGEAGLNQQVELQKESIDPREACTIKLDGLTASVRVGRYGPYLESQRDGETVNASLPDDVSPADLNDAMAEKLIDLKKQGPLSLGMHPEEGKPIFLMSGPFGPYLQLGEVVEDGPKPKRVSIPKTTDPSDVDFDMAMKLLELPRRLGHHPDDAKVVNAGIGRFGPYVQHAGRYKSLTKDDDVLTIGLDRAVELFKDFKGRAAATPLKELGVHPEDEKPVAIFEGRYGAYVKWGKVNATIPKDTDPQTVTLAQAMELLAERAGKSPKKGGAKKAAAKKAAPKKAAKKKAAKKKAPPEE